ncbi:hypothetical protein FRC04_002967 [Tulasnella sp. 424]|nr:hypothetical protein FRC04_002967 [Tulasnella sp. 424]KAG8966323.1 hypothetical protein FRC05_002708 [Tulasnella sp. 425]
MSSSLNFHDSDDAPMQGEGDAQQTPTRRSDGQRRQLFHTPSVAGARGTAAQNVAAAASSSPLNFPGSSSPESRIDTEPRPNFDESDDVPMSDGARFGRPLFHPSTPLSTPRRNRRGDVHPSQFVPSSARRRNVQAQPPPSALGSESPARHLPPALSVITPSEGPETTRMLWGTAVNNFNLKVKYRCEYDRRNNVTLRPLLDPNEGERKLYIDYLNEMRSTDQTTLNLDVANLKAYPGTKNTLYPTLIKYPQEVIPIMDLALREAIPDLVEEEGDVSQAEWAWAEKAPSEFGLSEATAKELQTAIANSRDAYKQFRLTPAPRRGEMVRQIREALSAKRDELGALVSLEMGKIYTEEQGEVQEFVDIVKRL